MPRSTSLRAALGALTLALALPAGSSAASWSPATPAPAPGTDAGRAQVVADATGRVTAAWMRDGEVRVADRLPSGGFGAGETLSSAETWPGVSLAANASGAMAAAWIDDGVVEVAIRPAGGAWGTPQPVSGAGAASPQVGISDAGDVTAAWVRGNLVETKTRAASASAWPGASVWFSDVSPDHPVLAVAGDGRALLVWSPRIGTAPGLRAATRPAGGAFDTAKIVESRVEDEAGNAVRASVAAEGATGGFTAVWPNHDGEYRRPSVHAGRASAAGDLLAIGQISNDEVLRSADSPLPAVAANGASDAAAVFLQELDGDADDATVQLTRRSGASAFGPYGDISAPGVDTEHAPDIAVDPQGRVAAVWVRDGKVEAVRASGAVPAASPLSAAGAENPVVTFDAAGDAVAVWTRGGALESSTYGEHPTPPGGGGPVVVAGKDEQKDRPCDCEPAPRDTAAPKLSRLKLTKTTRRRGGRVSVRVSEQARLTFRVQRRTKRGFTTVRGASFALESGTGLTSLRIPKKVVKRLRPGRHRLVVTARDGAGNAAGPMSLRFRVGR